MRELELSRRDFLFKGTAALASGLTGLYALDVGFNSVETNFLEKDFDIYSIVDLRAPEEPLHPALRGAGANMPFFWRYDREIQLKLLHRAYRLVGGNDFGVRWYVGGLRDPFPGEQFTGIDEDKCQEQDPPKPENEYAEPIKYEHINIKSMIEAYDSIKEFEKEYGVNINITCSIYDGFLFKSDGKKIGYACSPIGTKFANGTTSGAAAHLRFIKNKRMRKHFASMLFHSIQDLNNVFGNNTRIALELANEIDMPEKVSEDEVDELRKDPEFDESFELADWYSQMGGVIKVADYKNRPVLSGLARPAVMDRPNPLGSRFFDSSHNYFRFDLNDLKFSFQQWEEDARKAQKQGKQIFVGELGLSDKIPFFSQYVNEDEYLAGFIRRTVKSQIVDREYVGGGIYLWQLDGYTDSYRIDPDRYPLTCYEIKKYSDAVNEFYRRNNV